MKRLRRRSTSSRSTIAGCQFQVGGVFHQVGFGLVATSEHTVGRGDDIIEQLSSADRTSAALDVVHGSRVGLGGLVHFGGERGM